MSRIQEIFLRVRDTLNDHQKQRWSDANLLRNLNQGIIDIAIHTGFFKDNVAVALMNGIDTYQLPDNVLRVSHCQYGWEPIALVSSGWMDHNRETDWRYTVTDGDITKVVYDEVERQQLRVYPRPFGDYNTEYAEMDSVYGVTTGITGYGIDPDYGVVGSIVSPDVNAEAQNSIYGVLVGMALAEALIVYYTKCPPLPTSVDQDPPLDPCFDTALKYYVTAIALRNDVDTQNRAMGNEEFILYKRDLDIIEGLTTEDSVSAPSFESHYNPMG